MNRKLKRIITKMYTIKIVKKSWTTMKHLLPKKGSNFELKILLNDEIIEDKEKVAKLFNEAFNNVQSETLGTDGTQSFNINALNTLDRKCI